MLREQVSHETESKGESFDEVSELKSLEGSPQKRRYFAEWRKVRHRNDDDLMIVMKSGDETSDFDERFLMRAVEKSNFSGDGRERGVRETKDLRYFFPFRHRSPQQPLLGLHEHRLNPIQRYLKYCIR